jgi:hypothetical protein
LFAQEATDRKSIAVPMKNPAGDISRTSYCDSGAPSAVGYGDLTTILTLVEENDSNKVDAGYLARTPYVNSLVHIHSLALPIKFPLELRINQNPRPLARHINHLLHLERDY